MFVSVLFGICFYFSSLFFFLFSRHTEINPINLANATSNHISKNFLFNLPLLSSSSQCWNVTNHFSNQTSTHAAHSNTQINVGFIINSHENVSTAIRYLRDQRITVNDQHQRHFSPNAMINPNQYQYDGFQFYNPHSARATYTHHRSSKIRCMFELIAHFMEKYQAISYFVTGITFYAILIYFFLL